MTPDIAELKRIAQAATPGPWEVHETKRGPTITTKGRQFEVALCGIDADIYSAKDFGRENSAYIAAANPQAILALIERLEKLGAERKGTVRLTLEQAKSLELAGTEDSSYGEKCWCPACGTGVPWEYDGDGWFISPQPIPHREDCWLAAAIKGATE